MRKLLALATATLLLLSALPALAAQDVFTYDKPVTLKVSVFDRGVTGQTPVDNNYWTDWIQKNFGDPRNIQMQWVVIPRSEEVAKLNTLMASGEAADICITYSEPVITNFVQQGGLVELTDLIDKHGPNLKKYLGEELLKYGLFEGGQYAIPAKRVVLATQGMFIRSDWVEKLGKEMPTTKQEFYDLLVAFRDNDMNGDGNPNNEIPYAMNNNLTSHSPLMLSFIKDLTPKTLATVEDIQWDGYEDYVVFLNKLYNEGLVTKDFAMDKSDLQWQSVTSGLAGGYTYNYDHPIRVSPGILASLQAIDANAMLRPLNCFESVTDPTKYYHAMYAPNGIFTFVPVFAKNPEAAIMYLDWLCQYDTIYFLQNGEEGHHYKLNDQGIPVLLDVADDTKFNSMQNIDYTLLTNGQEFDDVNLRIAAQAASYQGYESLFEEEYNVGYTDPLTTSFHFDVVLKADSQFSTYLDEFKLELLTKAVMASPEECLNVFHTLRDQYMSEGGQAVMEEKIAAWDNMHGK